LAAELKKVVKFALMNPASDETRTKERESLPLRVWRFYYEGFRQMTVGKTLWLIILVKLFIFFVVMRLLFFPDILKRDFDSDEERAAHVRHELTTR